MLQGSKFFWQIQQLYVVIDFCHNIKESALIMIINGKGFIWYSLFTFQVPENRIILLVVINKFNLLPVVRVAYTDINFLQEINLRLLEIPKSDACRKSLEDKPNSLQSLQGSPRGNLRQLVWSSEQLSKEINVSTFVCIIIPFWWKVLFLISALCLLGLLLQIPHSLFRKSN